MSNPLETVNRRNSKAFAVRTVSTEIPIEGGPIRYTDTEAVFQHLPMLLSSCQFRGLSATVGKNRTIAGIESAIAQLDLTFAEASEQETVITRTLAVPASRWQAFKMAVLPQWALNRWPVILDETRTAPVTYKQLRVCPHLTEMDARSHVNWLNTGG